MIGMSNIYLGVIGYKYKPSFKHPNTIVLIAYYENGNKSWEAEYKNGVRNGKCIEWCKDGKKLYEAEYKDGKKLYEAEYKDGVRYLFKYN